MIISLDFETSGLNYWTKDFSVKSIALSYRNSENKLVSKFTQDPEEIAAYLEKIKEENHTLLVYNYAFEGGIYRCLFPHLKPNKIIDCMRLAQVYGLPPKLPKPLRRGAFGLGRTVERLFPHATDWKEHFHGWIRENLGVKKGQEMSIDFSLVPSHILEKYNVSDTEWTLKLYEFFVKTFDDQGYDWSVDHEIYLEVCDRCIEAQIAGIDIEREGLAEYLSEVKQELQDIEDTLYREFSNEILQVRQILLDKVNAKLKKKKRTELPAFNPNSKDHLAYLCIDILGIKPTKFTKGKKPKPSFKGADIKQWGRVGEILAKKGKRSIVMNQCEALLKCSESDSKFHPSLKIIATTTGRMASGD